MSHENDYRHLDKLERNRQEKIKNKPVTLPAGINMNEFYRTLESRSDITGEMRLAFLCFYLYSRGVGFNIICGYLHLTPDTVNVYVQRMQQADQESSIGKLRVVYDELGLPTSTRPPLEPTRQLASPKTPTTRVGGSVKRSTDRAKAMGRFTRIETDQPFLKPQEEK